MKKYSIWINPQGSAQNELTQIIQTLAKEYHGPIFSPHLTLCGGLESTDDEVEEKAFKAVKNISPFSLEFGPVEFSTTYFQCVLIRIKTTAKLVNTHLALKKSFGIEEEHVFMPHISLLYSKMDMEKREQAAQSVQVKTKSFTANEITITRADSPDPQTWKVVKTIPLAL